MSTTKTDLKIEDLELSKDLKGLPMLAKYDEAFKTLLEQVFAGRVILAPYERAFELYMGQEKEKIHFPFISIFPVGGYTKQNQNYAQEHIGKPIFRAAQLFNDDTLAYKGQTPSMQNFYQYHYYDIGYEINCWSTNRTEALQLVQELMFWLTSQGQVLVEYRKNKYTANMTVSQTITDNSAYVEYADFGNIYRFTLNINIDAPVFRTVNYLNITSAQLTLNVKED